MASTLPLPPPTTSSPVVISLLSPREVVINQIRHAFENYGFFELRDHQFPESLQDSILRASTDFFNLPLEKKMETLKMDSVHTGYESYRSHTLGGKGGRGGNRWGGSTVYGSKISPSAEDKTEVPILQPIENDNEEEDDDAPPDLNEGFAVSPTFVDTRPGSLSRWPHGHDLPGFEEVCRMYYNAAEKLSRQLGGYIALGLGLPEDAFEDFFCGQVAHMRLIHYYAALDRRASMSPGSPTRSNSNGGNNNGMGAGLHSDWGLITVLLQDEVGGLEVLDEKSGEFIAVPPDPASLIVNCGDLLELMTNKRYSAVRHRVVAPPPGTDRYSVAFFSEGNPEFEVDVLPGMLREGERKRTRRMSVGRYIVSKFEESKMEGTLEEASDGVGY